MRAPPGTKRVRSRSCALLVGTEELSRALGRWPGGGGVPPAASGAAFRPSPNNKEEEKTRREDGGGAKREGREHARIAWPRRWWRTRTERVTSQRPSVFCGVFSLRSNTRQSRGWGERGFLVAYVVSHALACNLPRPARRPRPRERRAHTDTGSLFSPAGAQTLPSGAEALVLALHVVRTRFTPS